MNVNLYTGVSDFSGYVRTAPAAGPIGATAGYVTSDFDQVSLKKPTTVSDTSFAQALAKGITAKLGNSAGPERVTALKQQVETGTYTPDSRRIAERMLGYR